MKPGEPSRTALGAAGHRAAHQVLEGGAIFDDPLALRILGAEADMAVEEARRDPHKRFMRRFIALRARLAEELIAAAYARGVRQLVVLGAGLDTHAYRATLPAGTRVFEVDHPATQAAKRDRLASAAIAVPDALSFVPLDFEQDRLADALQAAGFDPARPSFFSWLGVVPYLSPQAVFATLRILAGMRGGVEVVFDYAESARATEDPQRRALREALEARVAAQGEPFRSHFDPELLVREVRALGFTRTEALEAFEIAARYLGEEQRERTGGGHVLHAATKGGTGE